MKKTASVFNEHDFLTQFRGAKSVAQYNPRKAIFRQGEPADAIYYIEKGRVKLTVVSKRGKGAVIAILGPGEFFGEACMAGERFRAVTASALTESRVVRIEKASATRALQADSVFAKRFLAYLLIRGIRTQEDLVDQLFNSSEKRLARMLLLLANYGDEKPENLVVGKISQETLAEMVGTTRSRVSYFMNKFRKLGMIKYNGTLEVHSSLLSLVLHQ